MPPRSPILFPRIDTINFASPRWPARGPTPDPIDSFDRVRRWIPLALLYFRPARRYRSAIATWKTRDLAGRGGRSG
jgi:hypothetical protein